MYLYVLDYCQNKIFEIEYDDKEENDDIDRILKEYDLDIDTCSYMYSEEKLEIETIDKTNNVKSININSIKNNISNI